MDTIELKKRIIHQISSLNDHSLLEDIQQLLDFEANDTPYTLSTEQKQEIRKAQSDFKNGHYVPNEKTDQEIQEWLEK